MSLAVCQLPGQQYLKSCTAKVVSCVPIAEPTAAEQSNKKAKKPAATPAAETDANVVLPKFHIILSETVLFPEGGGQPFDTGVLALAGDAAATPEADGATNSSTTVLNVQRENGDVVHYTTSALPVGADVTVTVDWARRFDHMQQHSAQHLISAVFRRDLAAPTSSWSMAKFPEQSYIDVELDPAAATPAAIAVAEDTVNAMIQEGVPLSIHVYPSAAAAAEAPEYKQACAEGKAKAFPPGLVGPARCVEIAGLEFNTCCGTHVPALSHLGAVAITRTERAKLGGGKAGTRLWFAAGRRLTQGFSALSAGQLAMTKLLQAPAEEHVAAVERVMATARARATEAETLRTRLAGMTVAAALSKAKAADEKVVFVHEDAEAAADSKTLALLQYAFQAETAAGAGATTDAEGRVLVATAALPGPGDEAHAGAFVVAGADAAAVTKIGAAVATLLEGRGGGRPGVYQGKATRMDKVGAVKETVAAVL